MTARRMRLTPEHVARVHRVVADPGWPPLAGIRPTTDADYAETARRFMDEAPSPDDFWVFAYGSLIWNPGFDHVEQRTATAYGWHRAFCLGWDQRFRGNPDQPGLMLALDRGGACRGVIYRLPAETLAENLGKLLRREMLILPSPFPPRWINVMSGAERLRVLTFAMDRRSGRYVNGLADEAIADVLATAVGFRGSMAEYLMSTVEHLEALGIHDRYLWRLQDLVAARIEAAGRGKA